jgi:hypothetical protein
MARWLLDVVERYRVDTVNEALEMRDEFNMKPEYDLQSFKYVTKFNKKTEEEYQVVTVKKIINTEKDPVSGVQVKYEY